MFCIGLWFLDQGRRFFEVEHAVVSVWSWNTQLFWICLVTWGQGGAATREAFVLAVVIWSWQMIFCISLSCFLRLKMHWSGNTYIDIWKKICSIVLRLVRQGGTCALSLDMLCFVYMCNMEINKSCSVAASAPEAKVKGVLVSECSNSLNCCNLHIVRVKNAFLHQPDQFRSCGATSCYC